jgi:replicative DNA helicase
VSGDAALIARVLRRLDGAMDGEPPADTVPTGFASVDALLGGGLRRGDLAVLGGDVASGKSALALAVAVRAASAGHRAAYLTAECSVERLVERALCIEGRVRVDDLRSGTLDDAARTAVGGAALRLRDAALTMLELAADGAGSVAALAPRVPPPELLVVDGLPALAPVGRARDEALGEAARALKELARSRGVAVLLLAPLDVSPAGRPDPRPTLADFGAAGALAQQADVVLALYRERMYAPDTTAEAAELLVLKRRDGATGYADLLFYDQHLRFADMLDRDA